MVETSTNQQSLQYRLTRYSCAAGAGMLATGAIAGVPVTSPPMPVEGLPVSINNTVVIGAPLLLDIDSNGENDFRVYYKLEYGGGFSIESVAPVSAVGYPRVQYIWQYVDNTGAYGAVRNDLTESIPVNNAGVFPSQTYDYFSSGNVFLDRNATGPLPAYTPFRNNPGFVGLALGTANYSVGRAATLKVSVNANGTQLTIHSGWYRDDQYDLYLDDGILHASGFEDYPQSDYFPELALPVLAEGDTGEGHD